MEKQYWMLKQSAYITVLNGWGGTAFNNISVISQQSVLLVEETGVPGENPRPVTSHWQTLSHNVVSSAHRHRGNRTHNFSGDRHWLHR